MFRGLQGEGRDNVMLIIGDRQGMDEGGQRSQLAHEALKMTCAKREHAMQRIRQFEQAGLVDRKLSLCKLQHTVQRETKGMG
jgi:hypothetical protein